MKRTRSQIVKELIELKNKFRHSELTDIQYTLKSTILLDEYETLDKEAKKRIEDKYNDVNYYKDCEIYFSNDRVWIVYYRNKWMGRFRTMTEAKRFIDKEVK